MKVVQSILLAVLGLSSFSALGSEEVKNVRFLYLGQSVENTERPGKEVVCHGPGFYDGTYEGRRVTVQFQYSFHSENIYLPVHGAYVMSSEVVICLGEYRGQKFFSATSSRDSYLPTYTRLKSLSEIAPDSKFVQCVGQFTYSNSKWSGELILGKKKAIDSPNLDFFIVPIAVTSRDANNEMAQALSRLEADGICPKSNLL